MWLSSSESAFAIALQDHTSTTLASKGLIKNEQNHIILSGTRVAFDTSLRHAGPLRFLPRITALNWQRYLLESLLWTWFLRPLLSLSSTQNGEAWDWRCVPHQKQSAGSNFRHQWAWVRTGRLEWRESRSIFVSQFREMQYRLSCRALSIFLLLTVGCRFGEIIEECMKQDFLTFQVHLVAVQSHIYLVRHS